MQKLSTKKISRLSVFVALSTALTMFSIPNGAGGYLHFSNALMYICAILLSPIEAGIIAGVGQGIADILNGRAIYAPATFIIKFAAGFIFGKIVNPKSFFSLLLGFFTSFLIITGGYFFYKWLIGSFKFAIVTLYCNLISTAVSFILTAFLLPFLLQLKDRQEH